MGITSTTVEITQAEGWKKVLEGAGVIQSQGQKSILVKLSATTPTDDTGAFVKMRYDEVANTDSTVNTYVKVQESEYIGVTAVWKVS